MPVQTTTATRIGIIGRYNKSREDGLYLLSTLYIENTPVDFEKTAKHINKMCAKISDFS